MYVNKWGATRQRKQEGPYKNRPSTQANMAEKGTSPPDELWPKKPAKKPTRKPVRQQATNTSTQRPTLQESERQAAMMPQQPKLQRSERAARQWLWRPPH